MKDKHLGKGDIFFLEVAPETFVFGRVLFDVEKQCTKVGVTVERDNYLGSFGGCQLIEMYTGVYSSPEYRKSEVLISRVFVYNIDSKKTELSWGKIGHETVDYTKVEFPEVIANADSKVKLRRGELSFITNFKNAEESGIMWGPEHVEVIGDACLFLQNKSDLIEGFVDDNYLVEGDLLFHAELRKKIYNQIGEDPNASYYELAKAKGFDLARFY